MTKKQELKQALQEGNLYDFISNNGYNFSKSELIEIIKNLDFSIYQKYGSIATMDIENGTIENLNDYDFFEED